MPIRTPIPISQKVLLNKKRRNEKVIIAPAIGPSKAVEVQYRKALNELIQSMVRDVREAVMPQVRGMIRDESIATSITNTIKNVEQRYKDITSLASIIAFKMVTSEAQTNSRKFREGVHEATGINLQRVIDSEGVRTVLESQVQMNIQLIQSIPDQYFSELNRIVLQNVNGFVNPEGGLEGQILGVLRREGAALNKKTMNRAKLIARDQTAKTNAAINQSRQEALGVDEYIWDTSGDERVRESHRRNNGKVFKWSKPPRDTGHPGHDVNCRCLARAVIKI
jgi:SPP1 gp7 family putative phage head morphogenesis protein